MPAQWPNMIKSIALPPFSMPARAPVLRPTCVTLRVAKPMSRRFLRTASMPIGLMLFCAGKSASWLNSHSRLTSGIWSTGTRASIAAFHALSSAMHCSTLAKNCGVSKSLEPTTRQIM